MRKNLAYCASRIISAGIVDRNLRLLYRGLQIRMPELDNALGRTSSAEGERLFRVN